MKSKLNWLFLFLMGLITILAIGGILFILLYSIDHSDLIVSCKDYFCDAHNQSEKYMNCCIKDGETLNVFA